MHTIMYTKYNVLGLALALAETKIGTSSAEPSEAAPRYGL